jgi:hypothetical protein
MVAELVRISNKLRTSPEDQRGGFLVVPATLTAEEWRAQAEERNAEARDPSLPYEANQEPDATVTVFSKDQALVDAEIEKARNGLPSPLGEAILAFERKWGYLNQ